MAGYTTNNIQYTLWTGLAGTLLTFVLVVPPWPFFNTSPPKWLAARASGGGGATGAQDFKGMEGLEGVDLGGISVQETVA